MCVNEVFSELWAEAYASTWGGQGCWGLRDDAAGQNYGPQHERETRRAIHDLGRRLGPKWKTAFGAYDRTEDGRDCGDRAQLRAESDAYVAHLYGLSRDDFEYILGTFPVLERKEQKAFGEFMSKRKCLEEYDRLTPIIKGTT